LRAWGKTKKGRATKCLEKRLKGPFLFKFLSHVM
jgi:hypothetical protein